MVKFCTQTRDDHVQDMCCMGFMSIGVVVTKIKTFFRKCVQIGLHFCNGDLRLVGGTVGSRPTVPTTGWLAGYSSSALSRIGPTGRNSLYIAKSIG